MNGSNDALSREKDEHAGNRLDAAVSSCILVFVDIALVKGKGGELVEEELPVDALAGAAPGGGEVDEGGFF